MFEIIQKTLLTTTSIVAFVFTLMVLLDKFKFLSFAVTNIEKIQKVIVGALIGSVIITIPNLKLDIIRLESLTLFVLILTMYIVNILTYKNSKIWTGSLIFVFTIFLTVQLVNTYINSHQ